MIFNVNYFLCFQDNRAGNGSTSKCLTMSEDFDKMKKVKLDIVDKESYIERQGKVLHPFQGHINDKALESFP